MIKMLLTLLALFLKAHPGMPQNCHGVGGLGIPHPYLLASVSTKEVAVLVIRYSSCYTRHTNLAAIQAMQVEENGG